MFGTKMLEVFLSFFINIRKYNHEFLLSQAWFSNLEVEDKCIVCAHTVCPYSHTFIFVTVFTTSLLQRILSEPKGQPGNPRPTFPQTQVGLGITKAVHCDVIHVSFCTVQCVISSSILVNLTNLGISPPYYKKSFN